MIKIETIDVMGFKGAIKGMRNAMNSWDKSDSVMCDGLNGDMEVCEFDDFRCPYQISKKCTRCSDEGPVFFIGETDMKLAKNLIKAGSSDRKFMRMLHVQADVTAPLYWWKEYDTYKVATTTNSTSTMHTLHKRD
ncbi:MAG: hypothetical protein ACI4NM_01795, partial [Bullifex sp.]